MGRGEGGGWERLDGSWGRGGKLGGMWGGVGGGRWEGAGVVGGLGGRGGGACAAMPRYGAACVRYYRFGMRCVAVCDICIVETALIADGLLTWPNHLKAVGHPWATLGPPWATLAGATLVRQPDGRQPCGMLKGNPRGATLVPWRGQPWRGGKPGGDRGGGNPNRGNPAWQGNLVGGNPAVGGKPGEGNPKSNPGRGKRGKEAGQPWQGPAALVRATWRGCCEGNGATVVKSNQGNFGGGNWGQLWPWRGATLAGHPGGGYPGRGPLVGATKGHSPDEEQPRTSGLPSQRRTTKQLGK